MYKGQQPPRQFIAGLQQRAWGGSYYSQPTVCIKAPPAPVLHHRPAAVSNYTDLMCRHLVLVSCHQAALCCLDLSAWNGVGLLASWAAVSLETQAP